MPIEIHHRPSFAAIHATLATGETILAKGGAMVAAGSNIAMKTLWNGALFGALCRWLFAKEGLFINRFEAMTPKASEQSPPSTAPNNQLILSQPTPGDIRSIALDGGALYLQPGAFLACTPSIARSLGWAGFASWFAGEGLFRLKVHGRGQVWFGGYGSIVEKNLEDSWVVDSAHLLAYEPGIKLRVGLAGGIFSSVFGGEGFVTKVHGKGRVYMQSRSLGGLARWINRLLG